jgi:hypothetical protein
MSRLAALIEPEKAGRGERLGNHLRKPNAGHIIGNCFEMERIISYRNSFLRMHPMGNKFLYFWVTVL